MSYSVTKRSNSHHIRSDRRRYSVKLSQMVRICLKTIKLPEGSTYGKRPPAETGPMTANKAGPSKSTLPPMAWHDLRVGKLDMNNNGRYADA